MGKAIVSLSASCCTSRDRIPNSGSKGKGMRPRDPGTKEFRKCFTAQSARISAVNWTQTAEVNSSTQIALPTSRVAP
jgi:hypothetical protein